MRIKLERWSYLAKVCSIQRRKMGAKMYFVRRGVRMAIAADATIGRPIIQPRLVLLLEPEGSPRSLMTLFSVLGRAWRLSGGWIGYIPG